MSPNSIRIPKNLPTLYQVVGSGKYFSTVSLPGLSFMYMRYHRFRSSEYFLSQDNKAKDSDRTKPLLSEADSPPYYKYTNVSSGNYMLDSQTANNQS